MVLPQLASLHHWYSASQQVSSVATQIDDFSGNNNHGTRIGSLLSIVSGWFNFGEASGGGDNGISTGMASPTGSYSWIARVRRSSASNWGGYYQTIIGDDDSSTTGLVVYWHFDGAPGSLRVIHNGTSYTVAAGVGKSDIEDWVLDDIYVLAATYDSSTNVLKFYIDDMSHPFATFTSVVNPAATNTFAWFRHDTGRSWGHEASDVAYWSGLVLTADELQQAKSTIGGAIKPPRFIINPGFTYNGNTLAIQSFNRVWAGGDIILHLAADTTTNFDMNDTNISYGIYNLSAYKIIDITNGSRRLRTFHVPRRMLTGLSPGTSYACTFTFTTTTPCGTGFTEYFENSVIEQSSSGSGTATGYTNTLDLLANSTTIQYVQHGANSSVANSSQTERDDRGGGSSVRALYDYATTSAESSKALQLTFNTSGAYVWSYLVLIQAPEVFTLDPEDESSSISITTEPEITFSAVPVSGSGDFLIVKDITAPAIASAPEDANFGTFTVYSNTSESGTADVTTFNASLAVPGGGFLENDLLVVFVTKDDDDAFTSWPPTNWTIGAELVSGIETRTGVIWRWAPSGFADSTVAISGDSESYASKAWTFRGADHSSQPFFNSVVAGTSTAANPADMAFPWGTEDTFVGTYVGGDGDGTVTGYPTGFVNTGTLTSTNTTAADRCWIGYAESNGFITSGSSDPSAFTNTNEEWVALSVAVRRGVGSSRVNTSSGVADTTLHVAQLAVPDGGFLENDLLIVCIAKDDDDPITSFPSNWTVGINTVSGTAIRVAAIWYRVPAGFTNTTISIIGDSESWISRAWTIRGADVFENPVFASVSATTASADPPAITFSWGTEPTFVGVFVGGDDNGSATAFPSSSTQTGWEVSRHATVGSRAWCAYAEFASVTAGSINPGTFTNSNQEITAITFAVRGERTWTEQEVLDVTNGSEVSISGPSLILHPTTNLDYNTEYYILAREGVLSGFGGFKPGDWNFTTEQLAGLYSINFLSFAGLT